ncbi:hypothetical protein [Micromonospora sp. NPDC005172]|uniref:hypothetical protein n=1 Tax=Micromonospora sp. NPDC005172 TaxID=3156867 RepID=UPI0033A2B391
MSAPTGEWFDELITRWNSDRKRQGDLAASEYRPLAFPEQVMVVLAENQPIDAAAVLPHRLHIGQELRGMTVPFGIVHDWQAATVIPLIREAIERCGGEGTAQGALLGLHRRAAEGDLVVESKWSQALRLALYELYWHAYPHKAVYGETYARNHRLQRDRGADEATAVEVAQAVADLKRTTHARAFAEANAAANARALAAAYARTDPVAFAKALPFAQMHACARVWAAGSGPGQEAVARAECYRRLADGLSAALLREFDGS